jgi:hypothetical protein
LNKLHEAAGELGEGAPGERAGAAAATDDGGHLAVLPRELWTSEALAPAVGGADPEAFPSPPVPAF